MTAKIIEALTEILKGLNDDYSVEDLNNILLDKNFDDTTIGIAYSLVYDKVLSNKVVKKDNNSKNIRFLTLEEQEAIGFDNYNYLVKLHSVGLLDAIDFELVIEQLTLLQNEKVTKEDINLIVLLSLVDFNSDILPGSRVLLYTNDTIN